MRKLRKLFKNPFVQKWVLSLLAFVAALFIAFILYTYTNSQRMLQSEFTSYSELQTETLSSYLDDSFYSYNQIAALLSLNNQVKIYLADEDSQDLFPDLNLQIYNQLLSYKQSFSSIDSIYLFPSSHKELFTSGGRTPSNPYYATDSNWNENIDSITEKTLVFRSKNGFYPHLISLYYPVYQSEKKGMIIINIDASRISVLQDSKDNTFQSVYIVSDEGEIIYRNGQKDIPEPLDTVTQLRHFDKNLDYYSEYVNESSPYVYVQQHSKDHPWYYVTVTYTQGYVGKTYNIFTSLIAALPWLILLAGAVVIWLAMLATHPIRTISDFMEDPLSGVPGNISEPETEKLIRQFINYIQTNETLSEELNHQMEQQNRATFLALQSQINPHFLFNTLNLIRNMEIETLGYDHEAPTITLTLSRLLRYAVSSTELVSMKTEFYYTELYLNILNQRYKKQLQFSIEQGEMTSEVLVPKLILQPLIENAVFHGCSPQLETNNKVLVNARVKGDRCIIVVEDNGIGISPDKLDALRQKVKDVKNIPSDSIGLQNVALRMYLTYREAFEITIDSVQGQGTCITLSFPVSPTALS